VTALGAIPANTNVALTNDAIPAGVLMPSARGTVPSGWLTCDGSLVSTTTYAALFAVVGHKYNGGVDPGAGQFRLPNLRRAFPAGVAASGTLSGTSRGASGGGPKAGAWNHSHGAGTLAAANHQHGAGTVTGPDHAHSHSLYMIDHNHSTTYTNQKVYKSTNSIVQYIVRNNFSNGCGNIGLGGGITGSGAVGMGGASDFAAPGLTGTTGTENPATQFMDYLIKT
jgi:microcystin-dependent protein